jgi:hypothetical protein
MLTMVSFVNITSEAGASRPSTAHRGAIDAREQRLANISERAVRLARRSGKAEH